MKIVPVHLKNFTYKVVIGQPLKLLGPALREKATHQLAPPKKALIVTQSFSNLWSGKVLSRSLARVGIRPCVAMLPQGEQYKNIRTAQRLYQKCVQEKLDRSSYIIALGGGMVGDTAGFVAATYLRGIPLIQAPTTLLAMVDSSIGGKVGVDLPEAKNYVGSFYHPQWVWIDARHLESLHLREFRNGLAEVIKYGVIADANLFKFLEEKISFLDRSQSAEIIEIISRCVQIKAAVVSQDEKETRGVREILNFGHTLGHAIETVTAYKFYKHGEAIAIGMCAAGTISEKLGLWKKEERNRMERLLLQAGLPLRLKKSLPAHEILSVLARDKKRRGGAIRFVLPIKIGKVIVKEIAPGLALKGLEYVQKS